VPGLESQKRKAEDDAGARKKTGAGASGQGQMWTGKPSEMERLAAGIEKLEEADMIGVVRIVLENQTPEMYVKSDIERMCPRNSFPL
jgi:transcription initiation factor TFIID/TFIIF subunit